MRDTIYRDDAVALVIKAIHGTDNKEIQNYLFSGLRKQMWSLPSAEPEPTVIRSRTFMPTKDFKEWAERIRDVNPNAVVIPCDAEAVSAEAEEHRIYKDGYNTGKAHASAEAVQGWIPCSERLPDIACRCLVTLSNNVVAVGTLHSEGEYEDDFGYIVSWGKRWHLEPSSIMIAYPKDSVVAWMPLPKPYKGGDDE